MAPFPSRRLNELATRGRKRAEIPLMLAKPLINERVELEVNLIEPRREVNLEAITELARLDAIHESRGQTEVHQGGRTGIEPVP